MFDIGFWELALIGVVALIVIGPEKLPAVARTLGYWIGKGRRFVASVQDDLNREINKTEELKRLLEEQSKLKEMHEIIEHTVDETKQSVSVSAQLHQPQAFPDNPADAEDQQADKQAGNQAANSASAKKSDTVATVEATPAADAKTPQNADQVNEQAK